MSYAYLGLANSRQPQATRHCPFGAEKDGKDYKDRKAACDVLVFGDLDALWPVIFPLMRRSASLPRSPGPFRADQLRPGDPYELSHGHPILCLPEGGRSSRAIGAGAAVLSSDPADPDVGRNVGFALAPDTLRAPDLAVGEIPDLPGWVPGAPLLAVEYVDTGWDEGELADKIEDLLAAGTRFYWVVRLAEPRRVEVHQPGKAMTIANPGDELRAPGTLANPVRVEALYDPEAAREAILRNLLQRRGYDSLEAFRAGEEARACNSSVHPAPPR